MKMAKKISMRAFALTLAMLLAFSLTACSSNSDPSSTKENPANHPCETHRWIDANCTTPKTCLSCGATEGEKILNAHAYTQSGDKYVCVYCNAQVSAADVLNCTEHQWLDANCTHAKTCMICGETEGNKINDAHAYAKSGEWYACVFCDASAPQIGNPPTDNECPEHQWLDASCTYEKTCMICGLKEGAPVSTAHLYKKCDNWYACVFCNTEAPRETGACAHVAGADTCPLCGKTSINIIKNVIYMIGDGMGLEHIAAGEIAYDKEYRFEDWQFATVNTDSLSEENGYTAVTDSAASGTALATGTITKNGYIGRDKNKNDLVTILDQAKALGKRTGVITTDSLHGATPGAFSAHADDRGNTMDILNSQIKSGIDFLLGHEGSDDKVNVDKLDTATITQNGYVHCRSINEIKANFDAEKLYCTVKISGAYSDYNNAALSLVTPVALDYLDNDNGFVVMIEQAHIDKNAHNNAMEHVLKAVDELNNTVEAIFEWMGDRTDTAIIITADHETGDLSVSKTNTLPNSISINNGPTLYYYFNSGSHTNSTVGLFIYGADVKIENHSYYNNPYNVKNSDVYKIVYQLMNNLR